MRSVILVHSNNAQVKWDVDSTISEVHFDEVIIEDINTPQQILDGMMKMLHHHTAG